jgi:hypothetical protein
MTHVRLGRLTVGGVLILVLVGVLTLGALPDRASAAVTCPTTSTADSDGDGLTDAQECVGVTVAGVFYPTCTAGANRSTCVDPNSGDFFLAIVPASTSLMPSPIPQQGFDPFGLFAQLGVTAHKVDPTVLPANRVVFPWPAGATGLEAVRVTESLDTNGDVLGICNQGTPQNLDGCVVYTQRILNFINSVCNTAGDTTTDRQAVFRQYVLHTIVHETGHTLGGLAAQYNANYGGNHYKTGAGYFMDQSVKYTTKSGSCLFSVFQNWNLTLDPAGVKLK